MKQTYVDLKKDKEKARQLLQKYDDEKNDKQPIEYYVSSYILKEKLTDYIFFLENEENANENTSKHARSLLVQVILFMQNYDYLGDLWEDFNFRWHFTVLTGMDNLEINAYYRENIEKSVRWFIEFNDRHREFQHVEWYYRTT